MNKYLPYLSATGMALIFGFSFLFSKNALDSLDIFQLLFLRFLMAFLVMSLLIALKIIRIDFKGKKRKLKPLITVALLEPVLYFIMETFGLKYTTSSEAGVMMSFVPILTALFGFFILKERLNIKQMISISLSVIGVVFLVIMSGKIETGGHFKGVLFLFGAVSAASLYNVLSRKASSVFTPWEITYFMMVVGTAFFGMMAIGTGIINANLGTLFQISSSALISIVYLSIISSLIAFFLYNLSFSPWKALIHKGLLENTALKI